MEAAKLEHLDSPISEGSASRTTLVDSANLQTIREVESLVSPPRHLPLRSEARRRPSLALALAPAVICLENHKRVVDSSDNLMLLRPLNRAVASLAQQGLGLAQEPTRGPGLVVVEVLEAYLGVAINSSNNRSRRSPSVEPPLQLEDLAQVALDLAPLTTRTITLEVGSLGALARRTLLSDNSSSSSQPNHPIPSADLVSKIRIRPTISLLSAASASSNRIKNQVDCLAIRLPLIPEEVYLELTKIITSNSLRQEVFLGTLATIKLLAIPYSRQSQLPQVQTSLGRPIQPVRIQEADSLGTLVTTTKISQISRIKEARCLATIMRSNKSPQVYLAPRRTPAAVYLATWAIITTSNQQVVRCLARTINSSSSNPEAFSAIRGTTKVRAFLDRNNSNNNNNSCLTPWGNLKR